MRSEIFISLLTELTLSYTNPRSINIRLLRSLLAGGRWPASKLLAQ